MGRSNIMLAALSERAGLIPFDLRDLRVLAGAAFENRGVRT